MSSTSGVPESGKTKGIMGSSELSDIDIPDFPKASESMRQNMVRYFGIKEPPTDAELKMIDGMVYQMQMGAYNYLKSVFEKSRQKQKEEFRETWNS